MGQGSAENLANDPDFARLHTADPKMAEQLMIEALRADHASPAGSAFHPVPREEPLQETFTDPRSMALTIAGGLVPAAGAAIAGRAGVGLLGQLGAAAAGNEAVNLVDKATQPGATVGSTLTPGLSDAAAVATPFVGQAVTHPVQTLRAAVRPLAMGSRAGQVTVGTEAAKQADAFVRTSIDRNLQMQGVAEQRATALQQAAEANMSDEMRAGIAFQRENVGLQATAAKQQQLVQQAVREGNVAKAAELAKNMPGVPQRVDVDNLYAVADTLARANNVTLPLTNVASLRKELADRVVSIEKITGPTDLSMRLRSVVGQGDNAAGLTDILETLKAVRGQIRSLRGSSSEFAATELREYSRLASALEGDLAAVAQAPGIPQTVKALVSAANGQYKTLMTHEELTSFVSNDMVKVGRNGLPEFDPVRALNALRSDKYEDLRRYMTQAPFSGTQNMLQHTEQTLAQMASSEVAEKEALRQLQQVALAPKDGSILTSILGPAVSAGVAGGAAHAFGLSPGFTAAVAGATAARGGDIIARLMMTPWGQRQLLTVIQNTGYTVSPTVLGILNAAQTPGRMERNQLPQP